jgi:hypothetical protein
MLHQFIFAFACLATTLATPLPAQSPPRLSLIREMRVDARTNDLSPVGWLAVSRTGVIAVGQSQDHLIRYFDAAGKSLGTFGRNGEGPGEFRRLDRAGWIGDTLWVVDGGTNRFTLVSPDRKLLRNVPVATTIKSRGDTAANVQLAGAGALYSDGSQLLTAIVSSDPARRPAWAHDDQNTGSRLVLLTVSSRSEFKQLVSFGPRDDCGMVAMIAYQLCGHAAAGIGPTGERVAWAVMSVAGADSGTYRVTQFRSNGKVAFSRKYPFAAQPIPAHIRDSLIERGRTEHGPVIPLTMLPRIEPPHVYPPVESVIVGRDGSTWIALRSTPAGNPWVVLSPLGDVVGTLIAPRNVTLMLVESGAAWGTEKDADDVETIVRFRVVRR